jgi:hypothetical protein
MLPIPSSYQFPMQTPPVTYPRLPVAVTHALTLGARTGWHDLVQLSQYQPTGHHGWAPLTATEPVVSAVADMDASAKTNTTTAARRRNHCFIADLLVLSIQTFRPPRHPVNGRTSFEPNPFRHRRHTGTTPHGEVAESHTLDPHTALDGVLARVDRGHRPARSELGV